LGQILDLSHLFPKNRVVQTQIFRIWMKFGSANFGGNRRD